VQLTRNWINIYFIYIKNGSGTIIKMSNRKRPEI
jgi:hypothetical protein